MARSERIAALNTALNELKSFLRGYAYPSEDFLHEWRRFVSETISPLKAGYRAYWRVRDRKGDLASERRGICATELIPAADRALREICEWADTTSPLKELQKWRGNVETELERMNAAMNSEKGKY